MTWTRGPRMNKERRLHGCVSVPSKEDGMSPKVFVIGGTMTPYIGPTISGRYNMEVLDIGTEKWTEVEVKASENMHENLYGFPMVASQSSEYLWYSIGGSDRIINPVIRNFNPVKAIYGLTPSLNFKKVGDLKEAKFDCAVLNLQEKDIPGCTKF